MGAYSTRLVLRDLVSHTMFLRAFAKAAHARLRARSDLLKACGVDEIALRTDRDWVKPLVRFFRMRGERR